MSDARSWRPRRPEVSGQTGHWLSITWTSQLFLPHHQSPLPTKPRTHSEERPQTPPAGQPKRTRTPGPAPERSPRSERRTRTPWWQQRATRARLQCRCGSCNSSSGGGGHNGCGGGGGGGGGGQDSSRGTRSARVSRAMRGQHSPSAATRINHCRAGSAAGRYTCGALV